MVVIGVDVGLKVTGYAVCELFKHKLKLIDKGEISTVVTSSLPQRLNSIFRELSLVIKKCSPEALILEKLYSHYRHPTTLGILAQVRGVVVLLSYIYRLKLYEFSPTQVKKAIIGKGNASGFQVKKMVENILGKKISSTHIADAFSLIVTFSHHYDQKN
ncbi:MAG: hypothetical protein DRP76_01630 [Candidatus Omnitrophota bacterium]|nr:MAG: hypothetical protein DRP76_01630 [Candidatus Omnitrophota bacterium]